MRRVLSIGWLATCLLAAASPAGPAAPAPSPRAPIHASSPAPAPSPKSPPPRLPRVQLFGQDYVRLDAWAQAQGGQLAWTTPRKEIRVTLPAATLEFTVDSRRMTFRGVTLWLSHPVALRDGVPYVGAIDLPTALTPLVSPPRNPNRGKIRTIVLDPGHGGRDPGNMEGRRQEKEFTLLLARELRDLLEKAGFKVSLTRDRDSFLELPTRVQMANRRSADVFISLHFNSADGPGGSAVKGSEVYCLTPVRASSTNARGEGAGAGAHPGNRNDARNMLLAFQLQQTLSARAGLEDRGVKRARFAVLRDATMPAVLIEGGFMTSTVDSKKIYESSQRQRIAQAVVDGLLAYRRLVERP